MEAGGVCICARGRKKEQKEGKARGNILPESRHSLSIFLQTSCNRGDSLDAAGCKACH